MDALTAGADIATIATGLSAVTAAYVWVRAAPATGGSRRRPSQSGTGAATSPRAASADGMSGWQGSRTARRHEWCSKYSGPTRRTGRRT